jgi:RNA polymerase sigma-70 factor (ECF subfamily)
VSPTGSTSWDLIEAAARGEPDRREQFAALYEGLVRAFLAGLWRGTPNSRLIEDACQDVFVECMKPDGALQRADRSRPEGFRAFLQGVVRNVARRHELATAHKHDARDEIDGTSLADSDGRSPSRTFDREWALAVVREAAGRMAARAAGLGPAARRRVELLRLRFQEDQPIRAIAGQWRMDPAYVHHQYAKARREFHEMLVLTVAQHFPGSSEEVEKECERLLDSLD